MPWIPPSVCHLSVNKTLSSIVMIKRALNGIVWLSGEFLCHLSFIFTAIEIAQL
jgi:hypothetical protein